MEMETETETESTGQLLQREPSQRSAAQRQGRPSPRGTAAYPRTRAVKACQVCRARRTKCDNRKPSCSFCLKVGATCIQSPTDLSSFDPASLKILERLDDLEEIFQAAISQKRDSSSVQQPEIPQIQRELPSQSDQSQSHPPHQSDQVDLETLVLPVAVRTLLSWPCFQHMLSQGQQAASTPPVTHSRDRSRPLPSLPAPSPSSPLALGALDLEPATAKGLAQSFLSYVHVKNPILDERAVERMVQSMALDGVDWSAESCLSLLVCALGSIATPFGPSHDTMPGTPAYRSAHGFFQAAQKRLGLLLSSNEIIAAQCLFLSGVFMMCTFQVTKAWRFFLQSLAHCQELEFLSPDTQLSHALTGTGPATRQQTIYWSAWKSEREAQDLLLLPDFPPRDHGATLYPAFFPTPPVPSPEAVCGDAGGIGREQQAWYFYLAEISLRRLYARISNEIQTMQKSQPTHEAFLQATADAIPAYESQIQDWIASLPPSLTFDGPPATDDVCQFVLRGHAINVFEMIYWPFLAYRLGQPILDFSALSFPSLVHKALQHHALRITVNEPGFQHRHHGTYLLLQSCSRSALMLLAAKTYNDGLVAAGHQGVFAWSPWWSDLIGSVEELLDYWSGETRSFEEVRFILGQKLYV